MPSTLTFNYPNVLALAGFIGPLLFGTRAAEVVALAPLPAVDPDREDLTEEDMERLLAEKLKSL